MANQNRADDLIIHVTAYFIATSYEIKIELNYIKIAILKLEGHSLKLRPPPRSDFSLQPSVLLKNTGENVKTIQKGPEQLSAHLVIWGPLPAPFPILK